MSRSKDELSKLIEKLGEGWCYLLSEKEFTTDELVTLYRIAIKDDNAIIKGKKSKLISDIQNVVYQLHYYADMDAKYNKSSTLKCSSSDRGILDALQDLENANNIGDLYNSLCEALSSRGFETVFNNDILNEQFYAVLRGATDANLIKLEKLFSWKVNFTLEGKVDTEQVYWKLEVSPDCLERSILLVNEYWDKEVPKLGEDFSEADIFSSLRIDEDVKQLLILFKRLGLTSAYCCSGHYKENGYIKFKENIPSLIRTKLADLATFDIDQEYIAFETVNISKLEDVLKTLINADTEELYQDWVGRSYTDFKKFIDSKGYENTYYGGINKNGLAYFETKTSVLKVEYSWVKVEENHFIAGLIVNIEDVTECYR